MTGDRMKLSRLKDGAHRLAPVAPYLGGNAEADRRRGKANPLRRLYATVRWRRLRWAVLVDAAFTCARCRRVVGDTRLLVADHVVPHRGDEALFWDRGNLQCLCQRCHSGAKQAEEQGSRRGEGGV